VAEAAIQDRRDPHNSGQRDHRQNAEIGESGNGIGQSHFYSPPLLLCLERIVHDEEGHGIAEHLPSQIIHSDSETS